MEESRSVSQVNLYIKNMFTREYMLNNISVRGEVSNCKYHSSGHIYFTLKDGKGTISCVMFAGNRSGLAFRMSEGMQIVARGTIDVYERDGKYQLYAKEICQDGAGALYEKFEQLKQDLLERGMFAPEYKKSIPRFVKTVGIVTASTGAAVRDIINISTRRNPYVQLILYPAIVQGEAAAASIVKGIKELERRAVDVMIVGRGGGSIEDLWAFNEEIVARAIFECSVPIISAVGHETDTTIADYVADLRAPTPSAAAELAVYDYGQFREAVRMIHTTLHLRMREHIRQERFRLEQLQAKLGYLSPQAVLHSKKQYLSDLEEKLAQRMEARLLKDQYRIRLLAERLEAGSPAKKLSRGFSFVTDGNGQPVTKSHQVQTGDPVTIRTIDGKIHARVVRTESSGQII